ECSASTVPDSASRCRLSTATISFASTSLRASVVAMKPAPPVTKIRLPSSAIRGSLAPPQVASPRVQKTVLFVGAGRHQRRAILRAKELGLGVVAVDRNPDALGLAVADIARVVDFSEPAAVLKAVRRLRIDGVLTISADRAVPVVAAVAEARGLPGIGSETAH